MEDGVFALGFAAMVAPVCQLSAFIFAAFASLPPRPTGVRMRRLWLDILLGVLGTVAALSILLQHMQSD